MVSPSVIIWVSFLKSSGINFGFLNSYNMRPLKVNENQRFQVFPLMDIHANEFQPTNKAP